MGVATSIASEMLGKGSFLTLVVDTERGPLCVLFSVYVTLPRQCLFKKHTCKLECGQAETTEFHAETRHLF